MIVYCFTNTVNGKMYVGVTGHTLAYRWRCHTRDAKCGSAYCFHRAIRKHGMDMFEGVVLEECSSVEDLRTLERHYIRLLGTKLPLLGYNMTDGGDGVAGLVMTEETREKLRASHTGKKLSGETKAKMSASHKKRYRDPAQRKMTSDALMRPEIRRKMSENGKGKGLGRVCSEETRRKMSDSQKRCHLNNSQEQGTV